MVAVALINVIVRMAVNAIILPEPANVCLDGQDQHVIAPAWIIIMVSIVLRNVVVKTMLPVERMMDCAFVVPVGWAQDVMKV